MELVSVVVPVYNCEKDLEGCVDSIRRQTYSRLQIILADDGSTDGSGAVCDRIAEKDDRVLAVHNDNQGVSAARNCGILKARGKYVMFVDSDDFLYPTAVAETVEAAEKNQAQLVLYGFCYHNVTRSTRKDNYPGESFAGSARQFAGKLAAGLIEREFFNPPWNKLVLRELLTENDICFDRRFSILEDMTFSMQVLQKTDKVVILNRILYDYNIKESGSLVFKYYDYYFEALKNWYSRAMECAGEYDMPESMVEEINRLFVRKCYVFMLRTSRQKQLSRERKREILGQIAEDGDARGQFLGLQGERMKKWVFFWAEKRFYLLIRLFAWCKGIH